MNMDLIFLLLWPRYLVYGEHLVDPTVVLKHLLIDSIWIYLHFHSTFELSLLLMLFVAIATWVPGMLPKRLAEDAEFAHEMALQAELLMEVLRAMKSAAVWASVVFILGILGECGRALKRRWDRRAGVAEQRVGEQERVDLSDEASEEGDWDLIDLSYEAWATW